MFGQLPVIFHEGRLEELSQLLAHVLEPCLFDDCVEGETEVSFLEDVVHSLPLYLL